MPQSEQLARTPEFSSPKGQSRQSSLQVLQIADSQDEQKSHLFEK